MLVLISDKNGKCAILPDRSLIRLQYLCCLFPKPREFRVWGASLCPLTSPSQLMILLFLPPFGQVLQTPRKKAFCTPTVQRATWRMGTAQTASKIALRKWPREALGCLRVSKEQARFLLWKNATISLCDRSYKVSLNIKPFRMTDPTRSLLSLSFGWVLLRMV